MEIADNYKITIREISEKEEKKNCPAHNHHISGGSRALSVDVGWSYKLGIGSYQKAGEDGK